MLAFVCNWPPHFVIDFQTTFVLECKFRSSDPFCEITFFFCQIGKTVYLLRCIANWKKLGFYWSVFPYILINGIIWFSPDFNSSFVEISRVQRNPRLSALSRLSPSWSVRFQGYSSFPILCGRRRVWLAQMRWPCYNSSPLQRVRRRRCTPSFSSTYATPLWGGPTRRSAWLGPSSVWWLLMAASRYATPTPFLTMSHRTR